MADIPDTDRWRRIEALYHEALARDASEGGAFLASACGGDEMLRREVESLLAQGGSMPGLLDGAPVAGARCQRTGTRMDVSS